MDICFALLSYLPGHRLFSVTWNFMKGPFALASYGAASAIKGFCLWSLLLKNRVFFFLGKV